MAGISFHYGRRPCSPLQEVQPWAQTAPPNLAWLQRDQPSPGTFPPSHSAFLTFNHLEIKSVLFLSTELSGSLTEIRLIKGVTKAFESPGAKRSKGAAAKSRDVSPRCSSAPPGRRPSRPPRPLPWQPHTAPWLLHPQGVRRQCWQGHSVGREQLSESSGSWPSWGCYPRHSVWDKGLIAL